MVQGILIDVHYGMTAGPLMSTFADKGLRTATLNTFPDTVLQQTPLLATVYLLALKVILTRTWWIGQQFKYSAATELKHTGLDWTQGVSKSRHTQNEETPEFSSAKGFQAFSPKNSDKS